MKLTNLRKLELTNVGLKISCVLMPMLIIARSTHTYDISPCYQISGLKSTGQIIRSRNNLSIIPKYPYFPTYLE